MLRLRPSRHTDFLTGTKKSQKRTRMKETPSETRSTDVEVAGTATCLLPHSICIQKPRLWYVYIGTNTVYIRLGNIYQKTKTAPAARRLREHSRGRPGRVGRDEQGEARRANTTRNGGPHFELGRLRLKSWSESDLPIAATWPKYLYTY